MRESCIVNVYIIYCFLSVVSSVDKMYFNDYSMCLRGPIRVDIMLSLTLWEQCNWCHLTLFFDKFQIHFY